MSPLCETCLVSIPFGWSEVGCADCARLALASWSSLDAECVRLIAFGWEDAACPRCRGVVCEDTGLALAA